MKKTFLLFTLLWPVILFAQNFQWAVSCAKGHNNDFGAISSNPAGEIFLTGDYSPLLGIFGNDTLDPKEGYLYVMLTKISAAGEFQWTNGIKVVNYACSETKTFVGACKLTEDVFFFGNICGNNYFDSIHLISTEMQFFISKYDNDGHCLWAKEPGNDKGSSITRVIFDNQDNSYILGWVNDTSNFDGHIVLPGRILARFSPDGVCTWVRHIHGYEGVVLQELCRLNDGGFLFAGKTSAATVIIETDTLISSTIYGGDLLLVKYDSDGNYLWSKLDGQTGSVIWVMGVKEDNHGNFLVTGSQGADTLIFGNHIVPNTVNWEMFLVKYDSNGNALWATSSQGRRSYTESGDLFVANDNKIYVIGSINYGYAADTVHFGSYSINMDSDAIFVACYDSTGNCIGARFAKNESWGGPTHNMVGTSVTADDNGTCVVAGQFDRTAYFDETSLTSMGMKDIFIVKCSPITGVKESKSNIQNRLLISANPNTGKCNITIPEDFVNEKNLTLQIFDINGKLIQQSTVEIMEGKIKLDIQAQAKGMYTAILSNGKKSYTGKIVFE